MIHGFIVSMIHWIIGSLFHWFTESSVHLSIKNKLIHWLIRSLNHRFIGSSVHWFIKSLNLLVCCFVDLLVHFWIYSRFIGSLTQPFIDSLNHRPTDAWFTVSSSVHWLIGSLVHQLTKFIQIHPFIDPLFIDSSTHYFIHALIHWFIRLVLHGFFLSCHCVGISTTILLIRWCTSQLQQFIALHRKNFLIGYWLLITVSFFTHSGPGMGRALFCNHVYAMSCLC